MLRVVCSSALLCILLALSACGTDDAPGADEQREEAIPFTREGTLALVQDGDTVATLAIEIAETDSARSRGLMQRTGLPEGSGMFFIFGEDAPRSFWMANTPLPLDILFINSQGQIVTVRKYTKPYSAEAVTSTEPAKYVLEVPAGYSDTVGILEGDRIEWTRDNGTAPDSTQAAS